MARSTHYETLGLRPTATEKEVKAAYRRVVLSHHPDRNPDPASTRIFMEATTAYEALIDRAERRRYDESLAAEERRATEREAETRRQKDADARVRAARASSTAPSGASSTGTTAPPRSAPLPTQLARLSMLFSRGLYAEAEKLADEIVRRDPRQPLPYAVRGDLARQRGKLDEAAKQYSLAIQMDPRNPTYLRRYEEVLQRVGSAVPGAAATDASNERLVLSLLALGVIVLCAAAFLLVSEGGTLRRLGPLSSWSVNLVGALFLCGLATGASLAAGRGLDRLEAYAAGRMGPTVALGIVSVFSFPAAVLLYVILGAIQRGFNVTTNRLMMGVGAVVLVLAAAAAASRVGTDFVSVLMWGGNLVYLGALCGWAVADSLGR